MYVPTVLTSFLYVLVRVCVCLWALLPDLNKSIYLSSNSI